jgi:hypothetical protein
MIDKELTHPLVERLICSTAHDISDTIESLQRERHKVLAAAERIEAAIVALRGPTAPKAQRSLGSGRYAGEHWIPAAKMYLELIKHPVTRQQLINELVTSGAGFNVRNPAKEAAKSIDRALLTPEQKRTRYKDRVRRGVVPKSPLSTKPASLKKVGDIDLIGLPDWPDSMFGA